RRSGRAGCIIILSSGLRSKANPNGSTLFIGSSQDGKHRRAGASETGPTVFGNGLVAPARRFFSWSRFCVGPLPETAMLRPVFKSGGCHVGSCPEVPRRNPAGDAVPRGRSRHRRTEVSGADPELTLG